MSSHHHHRRQQHRGSARAHHRGPQQSSHRPSAPEIERHRREFIAKLQEYESFEASLMESGIADPARFLRVELQGGKHRNNMDSVLPAFRPALHAQYKNIRMLLTG